MKFKGSGSIYDKNLLLYSEAEAAKLLNTMQNGPFSICEPKFLFIWCTRQKTVHLKKGDDDVGLTISKPIQNRNENSSIFL